MSEKPQDPAANAIDQQDHHADSYDGQKGYGVEFEEGRYQNDSLQEMPAGGRSGSFESGNVGGYGAGSSDPSNDPTAPGQTALSPDPEAQQGQGGQ